MKQLCVGIKITSIGSTFSCSIELNKWNFKTKLAICFVYQPIMGREYFIFTMQSLRLLVSDKLESVLKYIFVVLLRHYPSIFVKELQIVHKNLRMRGVAVGCRTQLIPNASLGVYHYIKIARSTTWRTERVQKYMYLVFICMLRLVWHLMCFWNQLMIWPSLLSKPNVKK